MSQSSIWRDCIYVQKRHYMLLVMVRFLKSFNGNVCCIPMREGDSIIMDN